MRRFIPVFTLLSVLLFGSCESLGLNIDLGKITGKVQGLDDKTIADGLKEALTVGTKLAVKTVSASNGFFKNAAIKILLPSEWADAEKKLRQFGFGKQVDEYIEKMNRAAEQASVQAVDIFVKAVKDMTLSDVRSIWKGADDAATSYFENKTRSSLYNLFYPVIKNTMEELGVTKAYNTLVTNYNNIPGVKKITFDMPGYIDNKALDGLFHMLAAEESKIRHDPAARTTDLLRKVFG
jgi:hypothetical protein